MEWEIKIIKDIGSGLNEDRKGPRKIIEMAKKGEIERILITYPDRLTRFRYKTMKRLLTGYGVEIENIEKTPEEELVDDLITIIVHFAGKIYGKKIPQIQKFLNKIRYINIIRRLAHYWASLEDDSPHHR